MGPDLVVGLLVGLLLASMMLNGYLLWSRRYLSGAWQDRARRAEDAKNAAELRSGEQIDALLDRINTSPRLQVLPAGAPKVDPTVMTYIPDTLEGDEAWNEYSAARRARQQEVDA